MRVLVLGKAKTGTTALASSIRASLDPCHLTMEPRTILDFGPASRTWPGNEVVKILYEHYTTRPRHLDAIVHAEFNFPVHRVVCIVRDVRDEMVSKLLYHAKIARDDDLLGPEPDAAVARWVEALRAKEADPQGMSFHDLCQAFETATGIAMWDRLCDLEEKAAYERYITTGIERDRHIMRYEDFVAGDTAALEHYLGRELPAPDAVDVGSFGHTIRTRRAGNWREMFTPDDVARLRPIFERWLSDPIYADWDVRPVDRLDPAELSDYVTRTAGGSGAS